MSHDPAFQVEGAEVVHSLPELLQAIQKVPEEQLCVIGGAAVYEMLLPYCNTAQVTKSYVTLKADTFFPGFGCGFLLESCRRRENRRGKWVRFQYLKYVNDLQSRVSRYSVPGSRERRSMMRLKVLVENTASDEALQCVHGLSFYLEAAGKRILFDMGPGAQFAQNAQTLGVALDRVDLPSSPMATTTMAAAWMCFCAAMTMRRSICAPVPLRPTRMEQETTSDSDQRWKRTQG